MPSPDVWGSARNGATLQNGYSIRVWQTEDGLPQNSITAITQSSDGYIWIGTYGGLARFDGDRFQVFDSVNTPGLHDSRIVSLYEDSLGKLWIGQDSGNITRYEHGRFDNFIDSKGVASDKVVSVREDVTGKVWVLRQKGTLELLGSGISLKSVKNITSPGLVQLTQGPKAIWMRADGDVYQLANGKLTLIDFGHAQYTGYVLGVCATADGGLWVIRDLSIHKWLDGKWVEDLGPCPWEQSSISAMTEMRDGSLAIGTMDRGLFIFRKDGQTIHFDQSNGLPQNWVRCLYEDAEANLWVGAGTAGMALLRPTAFEVLNAPNQWEGRTVLAVSPGQDGALWMGTEGSGLYAFQHHRWTHYREAEGIRNQFIWAVAQETDGQILAGSWGGGVFRAKEGSFLPASEIEVGNAPVFALVYIKEEKKLWVGTNQGLMYLKDGKANWAFRGAEGTPRGVCALARDRAGVIWCAMSEGGLGRYTEGHLTQYKKADGLSSDYVQCLLVDRDGFIWAGTADGGLNRYKDGHFSAIGVAQGLSSNAICHLEDDGLGYIWMSTHHGIVRVAKTELNRCADGLTSSVNSQVYDQEDGLPTIEFSGGMQAAGCQTADGRIWFASSRGVVSVDPAHVGINQVPPSVLIESMRVDGKSNETDPLTKTDLQLAPENQRVEFKYTAPSFAAPNRVLFKYKLEGLDHDWIEAGAKRVASYSHLAAGKYRFHVIASSDDAVWSPVGAVYGFAVGAYFWQTWWFITALTIVILMVVAMAVRAETRRRMRRHLEHVERERSIDRERSRIAQDIHDDIGASLTRITMLSQLAAARTNLAGPQSTALENIHSTARELTRSLDEIVWAVDPSHDTLDSLVGYMGKFAQDFLSAAGVRCRLDLPMQLPSWPLVAQTRHHLFLAFKEALNNAIKHAAATEVRIGLTLNSDTFIVTVKDNGRGFSSSGEVTVNPDRVSTGHGLANLQRRLATIGGRCEISAPGGQGASVSFIVGVPASIAPTTPAKPTP